MDFLGNYATSYHHQVDFLGNYVTHYYDQVDILGNYATGYYDQVDFLSLVTMLPKKFYKVLDFKINKNNIKIYF